MAEHPQLHDQMQYLEDRFTHYKRGGMQLGEVVKFMFDCTHVLVEAVERMGHMTGAEKKRHVTQAIQELYKRHDPDIPRVPNFIEGMLEDLLLNTLVPVVIEYTVGFGRRSAYFGSAGVAGLLQMAGGHQPIQSVLTPEGQKPPAMMTSGARSLGAMVPMTPDEGAPPQPMQFYPAPAQDVLLGGRQGSIQMANAHTTEGLLDPTAPNDPRGMAQLDDPSTPRQARWMDQKDDIITMDHGTAHTTAQVLPGVQSLDEAAQAPQDQKSEMEQNAELHRVDRERTAHGTTEQDNEAARRGIRAPGVVASDLLPPKPEPVLPVITEETRRGEVEAHPAGMTVEQQREAAGAVPVVPAAPPDSDEARKQMEQAFDEAKQEDVQRQQDAERSKEALEQQGKERKAGEKTGFMVPGQDA
jgi:hypothetical protein